jgi:predicted nucleic acid-binding protein
MRKKKRLFGIGKIVKRKVSVNKVILDTNICESWMSREYLDYQPKICKRERFLFITQKIFGELLGIRKGRKGLKPALKEIQLFLKKKNIKIIKDSEIDTPKRDEIYTKLKKQKFKGKPDNPDLLIIATAKVFGVNMIFTNNLKHFEEGCNYLRIMCEKPFLIKKGSHRETMMMLRSFNKRYRRKKSK